MYSYRFLTNGGVTMSKCDRSSWYMLHGVIVPILISVLSNLRPFGRLQ